MKEVIILKCKDIGGKEYVEYDTFIQLMNDYTEECASLSQRYESMKKTHEDLLCKFEKLEAERNDLRIRLRAFREDNIPFYQPEE